VGEIEETIVAGCRWQVAGCRLQVAGNRLQVTGCREDGQPGIADHLNFMIGFLYFDFSATCYATCNL
jgi:hypothetical protein